MCSQIQLGFTPVLEPVILSAGVEAGGERLCHRCLHRGAAGLYRAQHAASSVEGHGKVLNRSHVLDTALEDVLMSFKQWASVVYKADGYVVRRFCKHTHTKVSSSTLPFSYWCYEPTDFELSGQFNKLTTRILYVSSHCPFCEYSCLAEYRIKITYNPGSGDLNEWLSKNNALTWIRSRSLIHNYIYNKVDKVGL